jgi:hypothetical protein
VFKFCIKTSTDQAQMRFWKDHPKEIKAGGAGGDFPAPFKPGVTAAASPPKAQDVEEPKPASEEAGEEEEEGEEGEEGEEEKEEEDPFYVSTLPHDPV